MFELPLSHLNARDRTIKREVVKQRTPDYLGIV